MKCRKGYRFEDGKCVGFKRNSSNIFRPSDTLTKFFLWATIIAVVISALIGAGSLLFGTFNLITLKILLTTLALGGVSLLGLVSGNNDNKVIKFAGIGTSIGAGILWELIIWSDTFIHNEFVLRFAIIISIIAFTFAHASILSKISSRDRIVRSVFWIVILLITAVSGMLIYAIIKEDMFNVSITFWRILGAIAVIDVAGSIALPILNKVRG